MPPIQGLTHLVHPASLISVLVDHDGLNNHQHILGLLLLVEIFCCFYSPYSVSTLLLEYYA